MRTIDGHATTCIRGIIAFVNFHRIRNLCKKNHDSLISTQSILSISAKMYSRNYDKQVKHNRVFHLICFLYSHSEKASPLFMHNNPHTNTSRDYTDKSTDAGCALSMECVMMMGQVVHTYPNFTASNAVVLMPFSTVNPVRKICVTPADSSQLWSSVVLRPATSTNAEYSSMYYT